MTRSVVALLLLLSVAWAQERDGGRAEITLTQRGAGRPSVAEVHTDPAATGGGELFYFFFKRGGQGPMIRGAVPPEAPGSYRFDLRVPEAGEWGLSLRHGVGLDLYYAFRWFSLEPTATGTLRATERFQAELGADVPRFVQPLGFGVFGVVLLSSLLLVFAVLRWLGRQEALTSL